MNYNIERENNIIKNIAKEVVFECAQRGFEVSQELGQYMVKVTLLNPKHGFTASEVMPRSLTQQMVLMMVEELKKDTPAMNCIRLQVYWNTVKLNVGELKKEYLSLVAEKTEPYLSELLSLEKEDINKMPKLMGSYVMMSQSLGNVNQQTQLRETTAALHSLFKYRDMINFFTLSEEQKVETLKPIAKRVVGIRLYLKFCGKASEGIEDVRKLSVKVEECKDELVDKSRTIGARVEDLRETISNVVSMDYFLMDPFQKADIYLPPECDANDLNHAKKILAIMLQEAFYISDILSVVEEIDGNVYFYLNEHDSILSQLHGIIKSRETVPTSEVFGFFDRLGELWLELQSYFYCLESVQTIMKDFGDINKKEYFAPTPLEKAILSPLRGVRDLRKKSIDSVKSLPLSSVLLVGDEDYTLEFNGFCAWTLYYTNGLLIPGIPQVEVHKYRDLYYSFASKAGRELWAKETQYYLMEIYDYVRNNPELVELLNVYDALYAIKTVQLTKTVERRVATRVEDTQTDLHPIDRYWDKDYTFSVWELKKRALTLSRLVKCVTKSVQTVSPHSHFRASIGLLAAPDKDKQVQTKRDSSCVHPTVATYLYGLRGHRENKFRVIDLTSPIDETFERQIVLEERPSCKKRHEGGETFVEEVPGSTSEPCPTSTSTSSSSSRKCDYYYTYDSGKSDESCRSNDSGGSDYYFQYNGEG